MVFDEGSGNTFLISRLLGKILDTIVCAGPIDVLTLSDCLVDSGVDGADTLKTADVEQELARLVRLALVDRLDC